MAIVIDVVESGRGTNAESFGGKPTRGTRIFTVLFDQPDGTEPQALDAVVAAGITPGSSYDATYTDLTARSYRGKRLSSGPLHEVTVEYLTNDSGTIGTPGLNPLERPVVRQSDSQVRF